LLRVEVTRVSTRVGARWTLKSLGEMLNGDLNDGGGRVPIPKLCNIHITGIWSQIGMILYILQLLLRS
jgi:hypothetical protein